MPNEPKKQFILRTAYTDKWSVIKVIDGKIESYSIVAYYELDGYLFALRSMGYEQAYFVPEYQHKLRQAKEELQWSQVECDRAMKNPVRFDKEEIEKYKRITHQNHKGFL